MEAKMAALKKASHCWWFDSHNSAKRSPWLQSTLSELEKKTKGILNLIEGDADSFAQRAEMYYKKRPELVSLIEDFYRSYRYLAEHHELLRSEAGARRTTLFKSDSSNQSCAQKTWDSTEVDDYPESEVSEVDDPEPEDAHQSERLLNLEAKSPVHAKINLSEAPAKNYTAKRIAYSLCNKQMENDRELGHQDEITRCPYSKECEKYRDYECNETAPLHELDDCSKSDDLETKALFEKIVDDVAKLTAEVENLKMEKETLMAELEMKDEEKRQVIRQLSLTVEILKEENVVLKKFIKDSKKCGAIFEFKKLKDVFSGTRRLFGLSSRFQPSLVAL